jgi:uncharacterized protein YndB with AHSA1/START domain
VSTIEVSVVIQASLEQVWAAAADLPSHAEWMADAESITFLTARRRGAGTRMEVATRVGPFRTTDIMEVSDWVDRQRIGVRHSGLVTGEGAFELETIDSATTKFTWRERLAFPWYLGGPLTARFAAPVLAAIWKRNLKRLKQSLER